MLDLGRREHYKEKLHDLWTGFNECQSHPILADPIAKNMRTLKALLTGLHMELI